MKAKLVGLSYVNEGVFGDDNQKFKNRVAHFLGKSMTVEGQAVATAKINLLKFERMLPELLLGATYEVDVTDKGDIRNLELTERPAPAKT